MKHAIITTCTDPVYVRDCINAIVLDLLKKESKTKFSETDLDLMYELLNGCLRYFV